MDPEFTPQTDPVGVRISDPILQREYTVETPEHPALTVCDTEQFYYPVDSAVEVVTDELVLQGTFGTFFRLPDGEMVDEISHNELKQFEADSYLVELMTPIKLMLRFDAPVEVATADDRTTLSFTEETTVALGARSYHDQPAGTITTTEDPADLRKAISALSSSLKTMSCERSWPTLRGHPPQLELGEELSIPDEFERPETGVTIQTPDDRAALYAVAPLAFYLGAELVSGPELRLQTDTGLDYKLTYRETFGDNRETPAGESPHEVGQLLKHVVTLDCLTRTEGYYDIELDERDRFEERVDIDFETVYEQSLAEQLNTYLSIPYDAVEPVMPKWRLVADVRPNPESAELLPNLVNDLGIVRITAEQETEPERPPEPDISDFARGGTDVEGGQSGEFDRGPTTPSKTKTNDYVTPPNADAIEQSFVGPERPFGVGKLLPEGFTHKFEQIDGRKAGESGIEILVVCNDPAMDDESDGSLYDDREEVEYKAEEERNLTTAELKDVLESDWDFVHYIGHIEDGAFVCRDGLLDVADISNVGVSAFLLNGCRSYETGVELVRAGSVGGIVTHSDVGNDAAVEIGRVTARLLNIGFSLRSALGIAKEQRLVGNQYLVVGDGGTSVLQSSSVTPNLVEIERCSDGKFDVAVKTYPTVDIGAGSIFRPHVDDAEQYYLSGGHIDTYLLSGLGLQQFLRLQETPVKLDGGLRWATECTLEGF